MTDIGHGIPGFFREEVYKRIQGRELHIDLFGREGDRPAGGRPVSVFIHGGGWRIGTRIALRESPVWQIILRKLLEAGYLVAAVEYRFTDERVKFPAHLEDCRDAVRWLRANSGALGVDPGRISLWGASAGGHLALMAAYAGGDLFPGDPGLSAHSAAVQSVVSWFGPTDFPAWIREVPRQYILDEIAYLFDGALDEVPERYERASPIAYLRPDVPPTLLIHGTADADVPYDQSLRLWQAGRALGAPIELLAIEGAGHGPMECREQGCRPGMDAVIDRMMGFILGHDGG